MQRCFFLCVIFTCESICELSIHHKKIVKQEITNNNNNVFRNVIYWSNLALI